MALLVTAHPSASRDPNAVTYGLMNRTHPAYKGEFWERLRLLKVGGYEILQHVKKFVPKYPAENDAVYEFRLKQASYSGLLGKVCGYLVGSLFMESLSVGPPEDKAALPDEAFYKEFFDDCDLEDTDFSQFMRTCTYDALIYRRALVGIDLPGVPDGAEPRTRAEEEALGLGRAYLYRIPLDALINWHAVPRATKGPIKGTEFVWAVIKGVEQDRSDPFGDHSTYRETFKVWRRSPEGVVTWEKWRTRPLSEKDRPRDDDPLELVEPPTSGSFKSIPIEELSLPDELWAGNAAGPIVEEHFRDRSMLKGDMARSLHEVGYVKQGPEMPAVHNALPSDVQQDPNRGAKAQAAVTNKGWVVIGSGDELGFAGPSGRAHALVVEWLDKLKEESQGVVNTMALSITNSASALQRSGESKREDRSATTIVLQALSLCVREAAKRVMRHVSEARNEPKTEWTATGLNTFDKTERSDLVTEAGSLSLVDMPSPTWQRLYKTALAHATTPHATPEQKQQIAEELQKNIKDEIESLDPFERAKKMAESTAPKDKLEGADDDAAGKSDAKPTVKGKPAAKSKAPKSKAEPKK